MEMSHVPERDETEDEVVDLTPDTSNDHETHREDFLDYDGIGQMDYWP